MTKKRMEQIRLTEAVEPDAIDFNIGGRSVIVRRQPAPIATSDFQTISSHYPGWVEKVEPVPAKPKTPVAQAAAK